MTLSPARSVALVTGGSRGIGAAISRRLAADGHAVAINYAGRRDDAEALAAELNAAGAQAIALQADVSDPQAVRQLFDAIEARFGVKFQTAELESMQTVGHLADLIQSKLAAQGR